MLVQKAQGSRLMPDGEGSAAKSPLPFRAFKLRAIAERKSHFKVQHQLPALHMYCRLLNSP